MTTPNPLPAMATRSLENTLKRLLSITTVFRHLDREPVSETVFEYLVGENRVTQQVSVLGAIVYGDDGDDAAVAQLLMRLDEALLTGDRDCDRNSFDGLVPMAYRDQVYGTAVYIDRDAFYDRYESEREGGRLRLFRTRSPKFIDEGELPREGSHLGNYVIALGQGAVRWRQLTPAMMVPLCPMREGRLTLPVSAEPLPPWRHETSLEEPRSCALIYGALQLVDPSRLFILSLPD